MELEPAHHLHLTYSRTLKRYATDLAFSARRGVRGRQTYLSVPRDPQAFGAHEEGHNHGPYNLGFRDRRRRPVQSGRAAVFSELEFTLDGHL